MAAGIGENSSQIRVLDPNSSPSSSVALEQYLTSTSLFPIGEMGTKETYFRET